MARQVMPEGIGGWAGYIVAGLVALFAWLRDRRKSDVDESTLILGKWKELVEQHEKNIKTLNEDFATYKQTAIAEISDLRNRLLAAEKRISELETENAGLKRAIAQNSQSTAFQLGKAKAASSNMQEQISALDVAGHNSRGAGK